MSTTSAHGSNASQTKKATLSGWIGSVLEYYDFFIYATAAALVFPQLFFPSTDPTVAIVASLATYGVVTSPVRLALTFWDSGAIAMVVKRY